MAFGKFVEEAPYKRNKQELEKSIEKICAMAFDEERAEQIVKKIVERAKADLITMIKEERAFSEDEKNAERIMRSLPEKCNYIDVRLKSRGPREAWASSNDLIKELVELRKLIEDGCKIEAQMALVTSDLNELMRRARIMFRPK